MVWTPEIVRARFVEAAATERSLPTIRRPSSAPGFWPDYWHSFEDMNGWGEDRLREEREMRFKRTPPSAAAISRHEEVMAWSANWIPDEVKRRMVWAWARCQAGQGSFTRVCQEEGWVKMTAYRRLHAVSEAISYYLGKDRVLLRLPDHQWLLQQGTNSDSDLSTLAPPDGADDISPHHLIFEGDRPRHTLTSPQAIEAFQKHLERVNKARRRKLKLDEEQVDA